MLEFYDKHKITLRIGEGSDAKRISALEQLCFPDPWAEKTILNEIMENDRAFYIVCEIDDVIEGYAGLWMVPPEGHITNVAVNPSFRRKGVAQEIVKKLIAEGIEKDIKSFTLEVRQSNEAAQTLYEKMGFEAVGVRKKYYYNNGEDAVIMWLHIE